MCLTRFSVQPDCDCIYALGTVTRCERFRSLPANRSKTSFNPKLVTGHCRGLDLLFNGVNFESVDIPNNNFLPNGLDCPNVQILEKSVRATPGQCPLCDSPEALKFLRAKGIGHSPVGATVAHDPLKEASEGAADYARGTAAGKSADKSGGRLAATPEGSPAE